MLSTKKNGNVPSLQTLMRTAKVCITEQSAILAKHRLEPKSRNSHSKTHHDPASVRKSTVSAPPYTLVGVIKRREKGQNVLPTES